MLASALGSSADVPTALASYAAARRERTARVQSTARTWGEIWHVDGVARLLRNELLRTRDASDHRHVDWLYGPPRAETGSGPCLEDI